MVALTKHQQTVAGLLALVLHLLERYENYTPHPIPVDEHHALFHRALVPAFTALKLPYTALRQGKTAFGEEAYTDHLINGAYDASPSATLAEMLGDFAHYAPPELAASLEKAMQEFRYVACVNDIMRTLSRSLQPIVDWYVNMALTKTILQSVQSDLSHHWRSLVADRQTVRDINDRLLPFGRAAIGFKCAAHDEKLYVTLDTVLCTSTTVPQ